MCMVKAPYSMEREKRTETAINAAASTPKSRAIDSPRYSTREAIDKSARAKNDIEKNRLMKRTINS